MDDKPIDLQNARLATTGKLSVAETNRELEVLLAENLSRIEQHNAGDRGTDEEEWADAQASLDRFVGILDRSERPEAGVISALVKLSVMAGDGDTEAKAALDEYFERDTTDAGCDSAGEE